MDTILVVNAGSSSLKFEVFGISGNDDLQRLVKGQMDGIGTNPHLRATGADNKTLIDEPYTAGRVPDLHAAIHEAGTWLREQQSFDFAAVGHRVVHGGPEFAQPVLITPQVYERLERYVPLAPLHQPNNLAPVKGLMKHSPKLPQVACFDTAFHRGHSEIAEHYAIPENLYAEGVRRYGFHGLSYEYIASRLPEVTPDIAKGRVIVAHLGSGASMCAIRNGRSIECTFGFTALDGIPMGTRPGQIDPGIVLYLIEEKGMNTEAVKNFLYHECGLLGLSGISNDVRELEASSDPRAKFALDHFAYRVALNAGMLQAALGGVDGFVFTAGIGENSVEMRARIAERMDWLGVTLDAKANAASSTQISQAGSRVPLYVIPTDEELMIARHTLAVITAQGLRGTA